MLRSGLGSLNFGILAISLLSSKFCFGPFLGVISVIKIKYSLL